MCGKNALEKRLVKCLKGSPPRVREKLTLYFPIPFPTRITPACAGKTHYIIDGRYLKQDHPRVCGKNTFMRQKHDKAPGSPPRVREKRFISSSRRHLSRITPACAGKTVKDFSHQILGQDHPRVCGKNASCIAFAFVWLGSPPRVREKLSQRQHV